MNSRAAHTDGYKPRHYRGWRRTRDRSRWTAGGSLEGMLTVIPSLPRQALARLVQRAIDHMDDMDGDPDLGPDSDELDGNIAEDDFHHQNANWMGHAGCPVSDPGEDDSEDRCTAGDDGCAPIWLHGRRHWGHDNEVE
ncbi:MAG: hypothetical protein CL949_01820 [Erythrobacter sp.]|nr:hypothetical protein [Erythrobacter sp.]